MHKGGKKKNRGADYFHLNQPEEAPGTSGPPAPAAPRVQPFLLGLASPSLSKPNLPPLRVAAERRLRERQQPALLALPEQQPDTGSGYLQRGERPARAGWPRLRQPGILLRQRLLLLGKRGVLKAGPWERVAEKGAGGEPWGSLSPAL